MVAGVCAGVAAHLGLSVTLVRFFAVAAAFCGGAGVMLYVLLWITVPAGDPRGEAEECGRADGRGERDAQRRKARDVARAPVLRAED